MQDSSVDEAIASHKTYGDLEQQHALFSMLRREDPVHWTEPNGYRPFWTVSKHKDVMEIEKQNDKFINAPRTKLLSIEFESKVREAMGGRPMLVRAVNQMDNPDQAKYKKLTHAWFQSRFACLRRASAGWPVKASTTCSRMAARAISITMSWSGTRSRSLC
jgi:cytochrome P450